MFCTESLLLRAEFFTHEVCIVVRAETDLYALRLCIAVCLDCSTVMCLMYCCVQRYNLCMQGDTLIRYYELLPEEPYVYPLALYSSTVPQRGLGFMPKRGVNVNICEIARFVPVHMPNYILVSVRARYNPTAKVCILFSIACIEFTIVIFSWTRIC